MGISEEMADAIPDTFRNNIRWNLGHIYVVQERLAFHFPGLPFELPAGFSELFAKGSTPLNWTATPPSLEELTSLMRDQQDRIRQGSEPILHDKPEKPFALSSPELKFETNEALLTFSMYHEAGHASVIKLYKNLLNNLN